MNKIFLPRLSVGRKLHKGFDRINYHKAIQDLNRLIKQNLYSINQWSQIFLQCWTHKRTK